MTDLLKKKEYGIRRGFYLPPALDEKLNALREETGIKSRNLLVCQLLEIALQELERIKAEGAK